MLTSGPRDASKTCLESLEDLIEDTEYAHKIYLQRNEEQMAQSADGNTNALDMSMGLDAEREVTEQSLLICQDARICVARMSDGRENINYSDKHNEHEVLEQPYHHLSSAQILCDIVGSIKMEIEEIVNTGQHDCAVIEAALERTTAAADFCIDIIEYQKPEVETGSSVRFLASTTLLLRDLQDWNEKPRNIFREIHMGRYTLLGFLSSLAFCTIEGVSTGLGAIVYRHLGGLPGIDGAPDDAIPVAIRNGDHAEPGDGVINELTTDHLVNSISRFIRKGYRLVPRLQIVFQQIELEEREMMLILSSTIPIIVHSARGKEGSVLIVGQVTRTTIQWIASQLEVEFNPNQPDGVFQTVRIR